MDRLVGKEHVKLGIISGSLIVIVYLIIFVCLFAGEVRHPVNISTIKLIELPSPGQ